jgi:hypothetical protein
MKLDKILGLPPGESRLCSELDLKNGDVVGN